jgi:hypothetical protein
VEALPFQFDVQILDSSFVDRTLDQDILEVACELSLGCPFVVVHPFGVVCLSVVAVH